MEGTRLTSQLQSSLLLLQKSKEKYEKAFGASERALENYQRADADLNLSRADVEKQRMNSAIKSQQCDEAKNEYANQLQKTNEAQVNWIKVLCKNGYNWSTRPNLSQGHRTIVFAHFVRPYRSSVRPHFSKQNQFQAKTMLATGEIVGLAEWIIDDTYLVLLYVFQLSEKLLSQTTTRSFPVPATSRWKTDFLSKRPNLESCQMWEKYSTNRKPVSWRNYPVCQVDQWKWSKCKATFMPEIDPRGRPQSRPEVITILTQVIRQFVRTYVLLSVRPRNSKSSENHCRPGLWAGRLDHWWPLPCMSYI